MRWCTRTRDWSTSTISTRCSSSTTSTGTSSSSCDVRSAGSSVCLSCSSAREIARLHLVLLLKVVMSRHEYSFLQFQTLPRTVNNRPLFCRLMKNVTLCFTGARTRGELVNVFFTWASYFFKAFSWWRLLVCRSHSFQCNLIVTLCRRKTAWLV